MYPTIGRIVIYNTTQADRDEARDRSYNQHNQLPAVVVVAWNATAVNLRVFNDGITDLWKTSVVQGDSEGQWN